MLVTCRDRQGLTHKRHAKRRLDMDKLRLMGRRPARPPDIDLNAKFYDSKAIGSGPHGSSSRIGRGLR
jgi:hypothetical protein